MDGNYRLCLLECQLLLILCAQLCVISYDECITPSHRTWWTMCNPGQNTMNFARFYKIWFLMCNEPSNSFGKYICEVMFSITANVTKFVIFCTHIYKLLWYGTEHGSDISKWQIFEVYHMEGKNISFNCKKMPVNYQWTRRASEERSKKGTFWTLSWNYKYSGVTFGVKTIWNT